jgi:uncharacterized protein (PEP-CTERM system associated)
MAMTTVKLAAGNRQPLPPESMFSWLMCAVAFFGTALQTELVVAGDWVFDHSSTVKLSHVDRSGIDGYSGEILQASPRLHLHGEGRKLKADINYNPVISVGNGDTDPKFLTHEGIGRARLEAVEDHFFIGADASARLTGNNSIGGTRGAPVDAINFNSEGGEQSYSFGLIPEYRQHLNRYAELVSRNRIDWVTYSGNDFGEGSSDSRGRTLNLSIVSGRHFNAYNWSLNATQRKTFYDSDRDDTTRDSVWAGLGYRFNPRWSVNGSIGYEDNDVQSDRDSTKGTRWDVGARWTPNPRTSVAARVGERYFGDFYSGDISHRTRRTQLSAGFSRDVTNRREQQLVDSFFFLADSNGNPVVDQNGNPIVANIPQLQNTNEDFINTQFRGAMTITGRRTNVTITGNVSNRDYEVSREDEDSYSLTVSARRDLGSSYNATLTGRTEHVERSGSDDTDTYDVRFSLSKNLSPRTSTALELGYRDYNAESSILDYTEKRIGVSFTTTWL